MPARAVMRLLGEDLVVQIGHTAALLVGLVTSRMERVQPDVIVSNELVAIPAVDLMQVVVGVGE